MKLLRQLAIFAACLGGLALEPARGVAQEPTYMQIGAWVDSTTTVPVNVALDMAPYSARTIEHIVYVKIQLTVWPTRGPYPAPTDIWKGIAALRCHQDPQAIRYSLPTLMGDSVRTGVPLAVRLTDHWLTLSNGGEMGLLLIGNVCN